MRGVIAEGVVLPIPVIGGLNNGKVERGVGEFIVLLRMNIGEFASIYELFPTVDMLCY